MLINFVYKTLGTTYFILQSNVLFSLLAMGIGNTVLLKKNLLINLFVIILQKMLLTKNTVQVENTGETDVNLGGYQLLCVSDGVETNYKFTRSHKVNNSA